VRRLVFVMCVLMAGYAAADGGAPQPKKPKKAKVTQPAPKPSPSPEPVHLMSEPLAFEEIPIVEINMEPDPPPLPEPPSEPGFGVTAVISAQSVMGAGAESRIRPAATLEVEGPIAWQNTTPLRMSARLRLLGMPGEAFDFTSVDTIRAVETGLGASYRVGRAFLGEQELWTSVIGEWGFSTALPPEFSGTTTRHLRHWGAGVRLEERKSGAWVSMLLGRNEAVGDWGWGQWMVSGAVPIQIKDRGVFVIGGDASLGVGNPCKNDPFCRQQDFVSIEVGISIPDLVAVMR